MKQIVTGLCFFWIIFLSGSCKKNNTASNDSIQGLWELRKSRGQILVGYPPGNGNTIKFEANKFEITTNGTVTSSGTYKIEGDLTVSTETCLVIPKCEYENIIIYDTRSSDRKIFMKISGNKLSFITGCFAFDAGSETEYQKL